MLSFDLGFLVVLLDAATCHCCGYFPCWLFPWYPTINRRYVVSLTFGGPWEARGFCFTKGNGASGQRSSSLCIKCEYFAENRRSSKDCSAFFSLKTAFQEDELNQCYSYPIAVRANAKKKHDRFTLTAIDGTGVHKRCLNSSKFLFSCVHRFAKQYWQTSRALWRSW